MKTAAAAAQGQSGPNTNAKPMSKNIIGKLEVNHSPSPNVNR